MHVRRAGCSFCTLENGSAGQTNELEEPHRFHSPKKLCRSLFLHVIVQKDMLYQCRGRDLVFWLEEDGIEGTEDAGQVGTDGKMENKLRMELCSR